MMSRKKKPGIEFKLMFAVVTNYNATVDAALNPEVLDKRRRASGDTKVFSYDTHINIEARSIYDEEEADAERNNMYYINLHSSIRSEEQYFSKLDDYHPTNSPGGPRDNLHFLRNQRGHSEYLDWHYHF